jgi:hypothetical protein
MIGVKKQSQMRTYDVNYVEAPEEEPSFSTFLGEEEHDADWIDDAELIHEAAQAGDEDALIIEEFESALVATLQESQDVHDSFISYREACERLRNKTTGRGFWPVIGKGKGKNKGKGYGYKGEKGKEERATAKEASGKRWPGG